MRSLALVAALFAAAPALAQDAPIDELEGACVADGNGVETCSCLRGFVSEHFSDREIAGAALVLTDEELRDDVPGAFAALVNAGYEIDEIVSVYNRVAELESAATQECAVEDG